ncbi:MAG: hypothetical protein IJS76_05640 [Pseudobutyrivibrio sp.]|nr:hypothetical protein [Pseudobutyrivibrio sp.]
MKRKVVYTFIILLILFLLYELYCYISVKQCIDRAYELKEGIEKIDNINDPLWGAQYVVGSHDSTSVDVFIAPKLLLLGKNTGKGYMFVFYKYYDENGELVVTSGPEEEIFYFIKNSEKWELEKVYRRP